MCFVPACGECGPCGRDRPALCEPGAAANTAGTLLGGERRWLLDDGERPHHHLGVSAFADHVVVAAESAVRVDPSLPPEIAALFGCAVLTGVGAVLNSACVGAGESVAVLGLGGVAVDVVAEKLSLALELGATHAVLGGESAVAEVLEATGGGAEKAIETVGSAVVLEQAYRATRRGGTTVTVGLPHPSQSLSIPAVSLVAEERTLKGSYLGSSVPRRDIPRYVELYRSGALPVNRLLTHTFALDDINAGFERLARGEGVRQAVVF
jgi:alcohol dehydrogenase